MHACSDSPMSSEAGFHGIFDGSTCLLLCFGCPAHVCCCRCAGPAFQRDASQLPACAVVKTAVWAWVSCCKQEWVRFLKDSFSEGWLFGMCCCTCTSPWDRSTMAILARLVFLHQGLMKQTSMWVLGWQAGQVCRRSSQQQPHASRIIEEDSMVIFQDA